MAAEYYPQYCVSCKVFLGYVPNQPRQQMYCQDVGCLVRGPVQQKDDTFGWYPFIMHALDTRELNTGEIETLSKGRVTRHMARTYALVRNRRVDKW